MRLGVALLRLRRVDAHGVIFGADAAHEAGDEAAARQVVDHRVFFGDHQRVVEQRQRAAEDRDLGALDRARQRAGQHAGRRHHAVGGLMVLVEADAVEAEPVGQLHLVEILVIELGALLRIVVAVGIGHPGRAVLLDRVEVGVPIRHQVEVEEFHAAAFRLTRKPSNALTKACRCSICGRCPQSGNDLDLRAGDQPLIGEGIVLRKQPVVGAPDQQRRHVDPMQPFVQMRIVAARLPDQLGGGGAVLEVDVLELRARARAAASRRRAWDRGTCRGCAARRCAGTCRPARRL